MPEAATKINGITDDMLVGMPSFAEVAASFQDFIGDSNLLGHNIEFDIRFLCKHGVDFFAGGKDRRCYDTLDLAQSVIKKSEIYDYKLGSLCSYYGIVRDGSHRALSDAYATGLILRKLVETQDCVE